MSPQPDGLTTAEADEIAASPAQAGRNRHDVTQNDDGTYSTTWQGETLTASTPFALDGLLVNAGAPAPRDLYLIRGTE